MKVEPILPHNVDSTMMNAFRPCPQKFFNEFVTSTGDKAAEAINKALLKKKIIGGLPLGRFYPELADSVLLCATEMSERADMDAVAEAFQ